MTSIPVYRPIAHHTRAPEPPQLTAVSPVLEWPDLARRRAVAGLVLRVADRLHRRPDAEAYGHGLTVGRVGLTGRVYRDPRFDLR